MKVAVLDDSGTTWSRGPGPQGVSIRHVTVLRRVAAALREALAEAEGQLSGLEVSYVVPDVCGAVPEVDGHIPMTRMGNDDSGREHLIKTAVIGVLSSASVRAKISVIHKTDVALVRAVDSDNIASA